MCPSLFYQIMRLSKDKKQLRYQMVKYALEHGVKPTARFYATTPKTIRKWIRRFKEKGYEGLGDLSRRPRYSPLAIPAETARYIVKLKAKYKGI